MTRKSERGRTAFETVIILVLVGLLLVIAIDRFLGNVKAAKESLLTSELTNIRTSIKLFEMINNKHPESLNELIGKKYLKYFSENTIIKGEYLETNAVNEEGLPLDPFGREYHYDEDTGVIKSLTKGYEDW